MKYKVKEIFASIKGEGRWLGYPMIFIRLAECDLACEGCDTDYGPPFREMELKEIVQEVKKFPRIRRVIITGGEPTLQPLQALALALAEEGYKLHLETNGAVHQEVLHLFNWIAFSPKGRNYNQKVLQLAHEVKIPIREIADFMWAESFRDSRLGEKVWYLHPWNAKQGDLRTMESVDREVGRMCAEYAIETGRWLVSVQAHKMLGVK